MKLFKSKKSEIEFQKAYDNLLEDWGVETQSQWVRSEFGETHIIVTGPDNGKPLVLLPGAQGTAAMWGPAISKLSNSRRIYSFDLIDQVGRSRPERILTSPKDCVEWIEQTLDALNLSKVDIVGNSLGSFMVASFASRRPERVNKVILTAPAATVANISFLYIFQVILTLMMPFKGLTKRFLNSSSQGNVKSSSPLYKLLYLAMSESKVISKVVPRLLSDKELSTLSMPFLLILGEKDKVNKAKALNIHKKLLQLVPSAECKILPNAGHLWNREQFRDSGQLIEEFLN
ncbi:alpha/beta hydrolase [Motilimonas cestriensis]|uniref:Alpha/beta hydrolase n=1 Tax=Motilimonas cestriensis TaxID=2742685 RepID=A0ABS8W5L4_9GAMM|nr:alpha/beta hydrolase [Motilimonas cestriensis]MCE2593687.1 alpha/beta hydrolase [Motilimonas cestriensis]